MPLGWIWWRAWAPLVSRGATALCVAAVALAHINRRFAWQMRHLLTPSFVSRGRRGSYATGLDLVAGLGAVGRLWLRGTWRHPLLVSRGRHGSGVTHLGFVWQVWRLRTSAFVWRGRRGTWRHPPSEAGVALGHFHKWSCVAAVAFARTDLRFVCLTCVPVCSKLCRSDVCVCCSHVWPCLTCTQEAMLACFACFALAQGGKRPCACLMETLLEAMLACFACFALAQRGKKPCACLMELCGSRAGMFRMFRFGPTWEEALMEALWKPCWHVSYVRFGPTCEEALNMFDSNVLKAMLACFACFALAQRGKRPCACLIETLWKRCRHVL